MSSYIKLIRLRGWYAFLCTSILGFVVSGGLAGPLVDIFIFFLMISTYLGFSFAINDSFDVEEDKFKKSRRNPVVAGEVTQDQAVTFSYSLAFRMVWSGCLLLLPWTYPTVLLLLSSSTQIQS